MIEYVTEEIAHTEETLEHQRQKRHAPSQLEEEIEQEVEHELEHEELEHERQKRQVLNLRQSSHLKWDLLIPYKFDGNHSKLIFCGSIPDTAGCSSFKGGSVRPQGC